MNTGVIRTDHTGEFSQIRGPDIDPKSRALIAVTPTERTHDTATSPQSEHYATQRAFKPCLPKDLLLRNWSPQGALEGLLFGYLGG